MIEKPEIGESPSNLAIIGRYILTPSIFNYLRKVKSGTGGEIQITDALLFQAKKEKVIFRKYCFTLLIYIGYLDNTTLG